MITVSVASDDPEGSGGRGSGGRGPGGGFGPGFQPLPVPQLPGPSPQ